MSEDTDPRTDEEIWEERRQGANDARHCIEVCLYTAEILFGRSADGPFDADLVLALDDCAEINHLAEDYLLRGSENVEIACSSASEICLACALICERIQDDEVLHECAEACRDTMESLRRFGAAGS